ncbi:MAG: glyoxylate/hydroxypyruvate reductase A [Albidovulum sp.]|nr:glyoxylate/hydroxypyruvate reductase A [Albidovulum sp.]
MASKILYNGDRNVAGKWIPELNRAIAAKGVDAEIVTTSTEPEAIKYIVHSPRGDVSDFSPFTGLVAVFGLWAGVEEIVGNPTLKVPLSKMVDSSLTEGMVEYVVAHVLRIHLGTDFHVLNQDGVWRRDQTLPPFLARQRTVLILGLGVLGTACLKALSNLNFQVSGWSRTPKTIDGASTYSGADGLDRALARADFVVLLLPSTADTRNVLDSRRFALMKKGASIINPGRGTLIEDAALLDSLDNGRIAAATLDVFWEEPLPPSHRYWSHPKVTVTPHIASETRPETASLSIAENVRRAESGEELLHLVDRIRGY